MRPAIDGASLDPLHRAAFEADIPMLRRLLETGVDPNEPGCVRDESDGWRGRPGPSYIATPLILAAASTHQDSVEGIRILLDAGADPCAPSTGDQTALWFAASVRNTHGLRLLLERGAPPNRTCGTGVTPLCAAAAAAHVDGVRVLLRFGASPHPVAKDDDDDPLEPTYSFRIP